MDFDFSENYTNFQSTQDRSSMLNQSQDSQIKKSINYYQTEPIASIKYSINKFLQAFPRQRNSQDVPKEEQLILNPKAFQQHNIFIDQPNSIFLWAFNNSFLYSSIPQSRIHHFMSDQYNFTSKLFLLKEQQCPQLFHYYRILSSQIRQRFPQFGSALIQQKDDEYYIDIISAQYLPFKRQLIIYKKVDTVQKGQQQFSIIEILKQLHKSIEIEKVVYSKAKITLMQWSTLGIKISRKTEKENLILLIQYNNQEFWATKIKNIDKYLMVLKDQIKKVKSIGYKQKEKQEKINKQQNKGKRQQKERFSKFIQQLDQYIKILKEESQSQISQLKQQGKKREQQLKQQGQKREQQLKQQGEKRLMKMEQQLKYQCEKREQQLKQQGKKMEQQLKYQCEKREQQLKQQGEKRLMKMEQQLKYQCEKREQQLKQQGKKREQQLKYQCEKREQQLKQQIQCRIEQNQPPINNISQFQCSLVTKNYFI